MMAFQIDIQHRRECESRSVELHYENFMAASQGSFQVTLYPQSRRCSRLTIHSCYLSSPTVLTHPSLRNGSIARWAKRTLAWQSWRTRYFLSRLRLLRLRHQSHSTTVCNLHSAHQQSQSTTLTTTNWLYQDLHSSQEIPQHQSSAGTTNLQHTLTERPLQAPQSVFPSLAMSHFLSVLARQSETEEVQLSEYCRP
jgi:hypothetical protein